MRRSIVTCALVIVGACGGDDDPLANADPRCAAICQIEVPSLEGAYDVCSTASQASCVDQCAARIDGVSSVCASCLLEDADFGTGDDVTPGDQCESGSCTTFGRLGSCTYPEGNQAAREDCIRQVSPRREVACDVDFQPVTDCASVCS